MHYPEEKIMSTSRQIVDCAAQGEGDHRGLSFSTLHMSIWFTEAYIPSAAKKKKIVGSEYKPPHY